MEEPSWNRSFVSTLSNYVSVNLECWFSFVTLTCNIVVSRLPDNLSPLRGVINALQNPEVIKLDQNSASAQKPSREAFKERFYYNIHKKDELVRLTL